MISSEFNQELDNQLVSYSKQKEYAKIALNGSSAPGLNTSVLGLPQSVFGEYDKKVKSVKKQQETLNEVIVPLDKRAVAIAASINELKIQLANFDGGTVAGLCSCNGTGVGVTMSSTILQARGYNFSGSKLFPLVTSTLTNSNAGFGTINLVSAGSSVGRYYTSYVPVGADPACVGICSNLNYQVDVILSKITSLELDLSNVNSDIRVAKELRIRYDFQEFSINTQQTVINERITKLNTLKSNLPKYEEEGIL